MKYFEIIKYTSQIMCVKYTTKYYFKSQCHSVSVTNCKINHLHWLDQVTLLRTISLCNRLTVELFWIMSDISHNLWACLTCFVYGRHITPWYLNLSPQPLLYKIVLVRLVSRHECFITQHISHHHYHYHHHRLQCAWVSNNNVPPKQWMVLNNSIVCHWQMDELKDKRKEQSNGRTN
jgi:hypothetical protein